MREGTSNCCARGHWQDVDVRRGFGCPIKSFSKVDILVNNAGIIFYEPVIDVSEDEFDKIVAVNVNDTFFACQEAIRLMSEVGRIINFSSTTTS